jgi:hypothetical protein
MLPHEMYRSNEPDSLHDSLGREARSSAHLERPQVVVVEPGELERA